MAQFFDRQEAGKKLTEYIQNIKFNLVAAIPRGGVPIGAEIAKFSKKPLLIIGVRKLPIPWNPEAGFGAVAEDGTTYLNQKLLAQIRLEGQLQEEEISELAEKVQKEIERRVKVYRKGNELPELDGKTVLLVDDGFASGYTAIAGIELIKKRGGKVYAAAPCAPYGTVKLLEKHAEEVIVINIQKGFGPFAVASYYHDFSDLTDNQVIKAISEEGITLL